MSDSAALPTEQLPKPSDLPNPNSVAAEKEDNDETLKNPDHEIEQKQEDCEELEQQADQEEEIEEEEEEEIEDEEGINMANSPLPQSYSKNSKNLTPNVRRNKKRKKGNSTSTHIAKQRKIQALSKDFNPIPFLPDKFFDFSKHENDLRKLCLWDFAHLQFDTDLSVALLLQLITNFTPKGRFSYVNEYRIKVNRADLARALKLPVKKLPVDSEATFSPEFLSFLEEFVSSWMLLQEGGDVCVMPNEIVNWMKPIKEGQPHRVDWAGLIWFMVEKELAQGTKLGDCYYASHLQQLIKDQRATLLDNNKVVDEVMVDDDEEGGDTEMLNAPDPSLVEETLQDNKSIQLGPDKKPDDEIAQKDGDDDGVETTDDTNLVEVEGEASKLKEIVDGMDEEKNESDVASMERLCEGEGMGNIDDNVECAENVNTSGEMSADDTVHFGSERNWLNGVNDEGQHVMQRCSNVSAFKMSNEDDGGCEDVEDEVGEDDEQGFNFMEESTPAMNEMSSRNLMQAIETGHLPYNTSVELGGQSSLGFLPSKADNDVMMDGTSLFDHVKREIDHEHDISHYALDENHNGMRFDRHWDHKPPDSVTCMDKILQWTQKLKMAQDTEKEEKNQQANMAQMYNQEKENEVIQWRCKYDELQRKFHTEVGRRDRELHLMNNVIDGYRRALKDSQKTFSEYRKRYQIPDEPIYKDAGSGGVVKSLVELEKEQIKQEEENLRICYSVKHKALAFKVAFESDLQESNKKFMILDERLKDAAKKVEVLRHQSSKRKMSKTVAMSEEVQSEAQELEKDELMKHKMSEDVSMSEEDQGEARDIPKEDLVEPKIPENVPMLEEGQGEAQEIPKGDVDEPKIDNSVMPLPEEVPSEAQE